MGGDDEWVYFGRARTHLDLVHHVRPRDHMRHVLWMDGYDTRGLINRRNGPAVLDRPSPPTHLGQLLVAVELGAEPALGQRRLAVQPRHHVRKLDKHRAALPAIPRAGVKDPECDVRLPRPRQRLDAQVRVGRAVERLGQQPARRRLLPPQLRHAPQNPLLQRRLLGVPPLLLLRLLHAVRHHAPAALLRVRPAVGRVRAPAVVPPPELAPGLVHAAAPAPPHVAAPLARRPRRRRGGHPPPGHELGRELLLLLLPLLGMLL